jgi:hypothetical protein
MAFTTEEQKIYDHVKGAMPPWWDSVIDDPEEFLGALVKVFDKVRTHRETLLDQTYILTADHTTPDWLGELAKDKGTRPQEGEGTDELRQRLRSYVDFVTPDAIAAAVDALLDAAGVAGASTQVDLRTDRAFFGDFTSVGGTGGVIAAAGAGLWTFTPTVPIATPARVNQDSILLASCPSAANDGHHVVTDHVGNGYLYADASGVAESAPSCTWSWVKRDIEGEIVDGFNRAFLSRGYRMGDQRWTLIVILPYGTDAGLAASVAEMLRQIKAAGVVIIVERRLNP